MNHISITIISGINFCLQIAWHFIVSKALGDDALIDAYFAGLSLYLFFLPVMQGVISFVLVPELIRSKTDGSMKDVFGKCFLTGFCITIIMSVVMFIGAGGIMGTLFASLTPYQVEVSSLIVVASSVALPFVFIHSCLSAYAHAHGDFSKVVGIPCFAILMQSIILFLSLGDDAVGSAATSIVTAQIITGLFFFWKIRPPIMFELPTLADLKFGTRKAAPTVTGSLVSKVDPLVDRVLSSQLALGAITNISFAHIIFGAISTVTGRSLTLISLYESSVDYSSGADAAERLGEELKMALLVGALFLLFGYPMIVSMLSSIVYFSDLFNVEILAINGQEIGVLLSYFALVNLFGLLNAPLTSHLFASGQRLMILKVNVLVMSFGLICKAILFSKIGIIAFPLIMALCSAILFLIYSTHINRQHAGRVFPKKFYVQISMVWLLILYIQFQLSGFGVELGVASTSTLIAMFWFTLIKQRATSN